MMAEQIIIMKHEKKMKEEHEECRTGAHSSLRNGPRKRTEIEVECIKRLIWANHEGLALYLMPGDGVAPDTVRLEMGGNDQDGQSWEWCINLDYDERADLRHGLECFKDEKNVEGKLVATRHDEFREKRRESGRFFFVAWPPKQGEEAKITLFWIYQGGKNRGIELARPDAEGLLDGLMDFADREGTL